MKNLIFAIICLAGSINLQASTVEPTTVKTDNNPIETSTPSWIIIEDNIFF